MKLKGVRIAMVTGKGRHSTDISLRHFELNHFFEMIETGSPAAWADTAESEKLQQMKPDELFYAIKDFENWLFDKI